MAGSGGDHAPIILKKIKKHGHGAGHGSSTWKIALADFMTAMFIIFMLLWIIKQTSPTQRQGIADYFSPAAPSRNTSGSGGVLGGEVIGKPGNMPQSGAQLAPIGGGAASPQDNEGETPINGYAGEVSEPRGKTVTAAGASPGEEAGSKEASQNQRAGQGVSASERQKLLAVAREIRQTVSALPDLAGLQQNLVTEVTPEGLRIQILDDDKREMFAKASAQPMPHTVKLLQQVAKVIARVPNKVSISGHTDTTAFPAKATYTNWELSADRANASRRVLAAGGVGDDRFASIDGRADRDPLFREEPNAPRNRRIAITLIAEKSDAAEANAAVAAGAGGSAVASVGPGPAPEGRLIPR